MVFLISYVSQNKHSARWSKLGDPVWSKIMIRRVRHTDADKQNRQILNTKPQMFNV